MSLHEKGRAALKTEDYALGKAYLKIILENKTSLLIRSYGDQHHFYTTSRFGTVSDYSTVHSDLATKTQEPKQMIFEVYCFVNTVGTGIWSCLHFR
jgi:hypothetical protein